MAEILTLEGFPFMDGKAHERLDAIDKSLSEAHNNVEKLEDEVKNIYETKAVIFSPFVTKEYLYLDGVNGDDDNDGKTEDSAFKTFERLLKVHELGTLDMRVHIISPGIYNIPVNTFNSLSWHINGNVDGIILNFDVGENHVSFYGEHYNLKNITLKSLGEIRFEGGTIGLDTVTFDCPVLKMHDCYIDASTTITVPQFALYACRGRIRRLVSTAQSEYAIIAHRGCNIRFYNSITFAAQESENVNTAIYIMNGFLWCDWSSVVGSGFLNAIKAESAVVALGRERYAMLSDLATNMLATTDSLPSFFINSTSYTNGEY